MIKKNINIIALALTILASSCQKSLLDKDPLDSTSAATYWRNESDVQGGLTGVYSRLKANFLGYERIYLDGLSDNAFLYDNTNQANFSGLTTGSITPMTGGALNNMYNSPYALVAQCNFFLDNVGRAPLTDAQLNPYRAEARFLRALAYFDLVQTFGGVVVYTTAPKTLESSRIAKSSEAQVYEVIINDLDFAIANLPDTRYSGKAVKGSAQGLKARVLLTQEKFAEAAALCKEIIDGGKFGLSNNYASLFKTSGQVNASVNTEIMFATQYLAVTSPQRTSPGAAGMDIELGWWSLLQPYQDLANAYECTDGKPITTSPLYNAATPYNNRDPRMDMTLKLPTETWRNPVTNVPWTAFQTPSFTGYLMEKYVDLSRAPFTVATAVNTDQDYIHLRFADILLMYAEAVNEATGPSAAAYDALDRVRARATVNMPAVDRAAYNSKETLRNFIRNERRVELALEGQRFNDLKRWKIAHIKLPTLKTPNGTSLIFNMNNYKYPFAQRERENNPLLEQNDGY